MNEGRPSRDHSGSEIARDRASNLLRKRFSQMSIGSTASDVRRASHMKRGSMGTLSFVNEPSDLGARPNVNLENTYQLQPSTRFPDVIVKEIIRETFENYLINEQYNPDICRSMSKTLSDVIKSKVKDLKLSRYRIISLVNIGQLTHQGLLVSSRCLWDSSADTSATYNFQNGSLFAVGTVYGVYSE